MQQTNKQCLKCYENLSIFNSFVHKNSNVFEISRSCNWLLFELVLRFTSMLYSTWLVITRTHGVWWQICFFKFLNFSLWHVLIHFVAINVPAANLIKKFIIVVFFQYSIHAYSVTSVQDLAVLFKKILHFLEQWCFQFHKFPKIEAVLVGKFVYHGRVNHPCLPAGKFYIGFLFYCIVVSHHTI